MTRDEFKLAVLERDGRVLVRFWADWCVPCHAMLPVIERIVTEHGLELVNVDVNDSQAVAAELGVQSLPTMMMFEDGQPAGTVVGPMPKARLVQRLGLGRV